ncbi:MAG: hypothetical protein ACUVX8_16440, partial [Candidatus Zipacnadales bacterium]
SHWPWSEGTDPRQGGQSSTIMGRFPTAATGLPGDVGYLYPAILSLDRCYVGGQRTVDFLTLDDIRAIRKHTHEILSIFKAVRSCLRPYGVFAWGQQNLAHEGGYRND